MKPNIDYPLQPCDPTKWARYDSLPIERACFVLFGFEPPPLDVLRFQQNDWNPTREPIYEVPPEYSDALDSLRVSIQRGGVSALGITEYPYETQHVTWPELVRWARAKGFTIPIEIAAIVEKMDTSTEDVRTHQGDIKRAVSGTSSPPETETAPVVAGASDGAEPALAAPVEPASASSAAGSSPPANSPRFSMTKAAMISQHRHHWPSIEGDMGDAKRNGLHVTKAGARGWFEDVALAWARANNKLTDAAKPAAPLTLAMNNWQR